jgi:hypothetical protein
LNVKLVGASRNRKVKCLERNSVNKIYFWRLTTNNPQRQFSTEMKRKDKDLKMIKIMYTDFITKEIGLLNL